MCLNLTKQRRGAQQEQQLLHHTFERLRTQFCERVEITPLVTFSNNFKLFSDPTHHHGTARPGISRVYIHEFIPKEKVIEMEVSDLANYCFREINQPLMDEYPRLKDEKAQ